MASKGRPEFEGREGGSVQQLFEQIVTERNAKSPPAGNKYSLWYAGYCPRAIYYSKLYAPNWDLQGIIRVFLGSAMHEAIEPEYIKKFSCLSEKRGRRAFGDIIISYKFDLMGEKWIADLKTSNKLPKQPKPDDVCQINMYMALEKKQKGILIYLNMPRFLGTDKEGPLAREFLIRYDKHIAQNIVEKYQYIHQHVKQKVPPPMEHDIFPCGKDGGHNCWWCNSKELCKRD